jgi:MFS family permease
VSVNFIYVLSLLHGVGVFSSQMVLPLYALNLGASPVAVGLLAATFSLFPTLLAVTAGRLIDRFGARWPMTAGSLVCGLGMLVPYFFHSLPAVYFAGAMNGLSAVLFSLAAQNLVGVLSTPETRARDFSNYMLTHSFAQFLAPLLGGFSIDHAGHALACLFIATLSLGPIAVLATRGKLLPGGMARSAKGGGGGIRAMLTDPAVRRTLITGSLLSAGLNMYQIYMPVYAHSIGLSASAIGVILAMNSSAALVSRFGLPRLIREFGEERLLAYAFFLGAASLVLIPVFRIPALLAFISFWFGLGMGCGQPIVIMLMYSNSRDGRSGEALGLKVMTNQLTKLVAPVLFGAIASGLGLLAMFWFNATLMAAAGAVSRSAKTAAGDRPA